MFRKRAWVLVAVLIGGVGLYGFGRWGACREPATVSVAAMRPFFKTFVVPEQHGDASWAGESMRTIIAYRFDIDKLQVIEGGKNVVRPGWFFRMHGATTKWEQNPGDGLISPNFSGMVDGYRAEYRSFENVVPLAVFSFVNGRLVEARDGVVTVEFIEGKLWRMTCMDNTPASREVQREFHLNANGHLDSYTRRDWVHCPLWKSQNPVKGRTDEFYGPDGTMEERIERTEDGKLVELRWRNEGRDWVKYFDETGVFVKDWDVAAPGATQAPAMTRP